MITYVSSPYSSATIPPLNQWQRACAAAGWLIGTGRTVFSPIAHSYGIERHGAERWHHEWLKQDLAFLRLCGELVELHTQGWEYSLGMAQERRLALDMGIPILEMYVDGEVFEIGPHRIGTIEGFAV